MVKLKIIEGPDSGREFELETDRACLGRQEDCDLQLLENSVSRQHASLEQRNGEWVLRDLGSQNGSYLNERKISEEKLRHGDRFRLGNQVMLQFIAPSGEAAESTGGQMSHSASAAVSRATDMPSNKTQSTEARHEELSWSAGRIQPPTPTVATKGAPTPPLSPEAGLEQINRMGAVYPRSAEQFAQVIVGQTSILEQILVAVAANGHCLMIGLPGLAKTLMVSTLAQILRLDFKRIQFTPDLMPSDILGTEVLNVNEATGEKSFRFIRGPVFTNMLLADEINRTPPKTQAALLESMQERQVSIANQTFPLPSPFFVLATQNPLEQEGTYPLPEAQLDRFMFNIAVAYPEREEEEEIVARTTVAATGAPQSVLSAEETLQLQAAVRAMPVSRHIIKYATALARATRPGEAGAPGFVREHVHCGAGPRAAQNLILGAKARAVLNGRVNVSCEDVRSLAPPVMRHRIFTNFTADSEGVTADDLIRRVIDTVPEPKPEEYSE